MAKASLELDFSFPEPAEGEVDILVIAGEHSGDEHAARMIRSAMQQNPHLKIAAIGGHHMKEAGAQLLFDLIQYSVIGFVEVLKHYKIYKKIFEETISWIQRHMPRAICFVDYPGLNKRLARKLFDLGLARKAGGSLTMLYYISPQIWAWRAKRRFEMAKLFDSIAVIFPFEVETYGDTSLETRFVGHPFLADDYELPVQFDADGPILLLPGSRHSAVQRIAPVIFEAFHLCLRDRNKLQAICIYPSEAIKEQLALMLNKEDELRKHVRLVSNDKAISGRAVLTSSGTMSLNCALANIPGAVVYRTHPLTYLFGKALMKVPFIGMANIILREAMYPEFIQGAARPSVLCEQILECMENPDRIRSTRNLGAKLRDLLDKPRKGGPASWLLEKLG